VIASQVRAVFGQCGSLPEYTRNPLEPIDVDTQLSRVYDHYVSAAARVCLSPFWVVNPVDLFVVIVIVVVVINMRHHPPLHLTRIVMYVAMMPLPSADANIRLLAADDARGAVAAGARLLRPQLLPGMAHHTLVYRTKSTDR
jgi:hypothetical protein